MICGSWLPSLPSSSSGAYNGRESCRKYPTASFAIVPTMSKNSCHLVRYRVYLVATQLQGFSRSSILGYSPIRIRCVCGLKQELSDVVEASEFFGGRHRVESFSLYIGSVWVRLCSGSVVASIATSVSTQFRFGRNFYGIGEKDWR
jgi:hypothetical protein